MISLFLSAASLALLAQGQPPANPGQQPATQGQPPGGGGGRGF